MIKKPLLVVFLTIISLFTFNEAANAYYVVSEDDPNAIIMSPNYNAADDNIKMNYASGRVKSHTIKSFADANYTSPITTKSNEATTYFTGVGLTCVTFYEVTAFGDSGEQIAQVRLAIEEGDLMNPRCESAGQEEEPAETCDICAIFECPGWDEFMGGLGEIVAAIPPAPNWEEVIGSAPEPTLPADLPETPDAPEAPEQPSLDPINIDQPEGQEVEGLDEAGFDADKLKDEAPVIEEREDPTGGFQIGDPVGSLPSQEEFIKNVPDEGEAPLPGAPEEPENVAPLPGDTKDTAPMPGDTTDTAPTPGDTTDTAPMPGDTKDTAPVPGDTTDNAPMPGDSGGTAPIPNESMTAPLPSGDSSKAPIPGDDSQFTAPIP